MAVYSITPDTYRMYELFNLIGHEPVLPDEEPVDGEGVSQATLDQIAANTAGVAANAAAIATNESNITANTTGVSNNASRITNLEDAETPSYPAIDLSISIPGTVRTDEHALSTFVGGQYTYAGDGPANITNVTYMVDVEDSGSPSKIDVFINGASILPAPIDELSEVTIPPFVINVGDVIEIATTVGGNRDASNITVELN